MSRLLFTCLVAFIVAACSAETDTVEELEGYQIGDEIVIVHEHRDVVIGDADTLCTCQSYACERDWIAANLGCDVCLLVLCAGDAPLTPDDDPADADYRGTCVYCPNTSNRAPGGLDQIAAPVFAR